LGLSFSVRQNYQKNFQKLLSHIGPFIDAISPAGTERK
jgi:hypothetical protein